MRKTVIAIFIILFCAPCFSSAEAGDKARKRDESMLRSSFEDPIQAELLKSGLTPRNAEAATSTVLNQLFRCWADERNQERDSEETTIAVQLGGTTIVTHKSPCIDELLATVGEIAR